MDAITQFWQQVEPLLVTQQPNIFYRLYYDKDSGRPLFYSMEDLPGTWIEIDRATFAAGDTKIKVRNNQIIPDQLGSINKLVPAEFGVCCYKHDITIVSSHSETQHWNLKYYD